jgi:hypothetical protein
MPGTDGQCPHEETRLFKVYVDGKGRTVYVYQCKKCGAFIEVVQS